MEQVIQAFGIDGRLIIIQAVNFGILLFALWYFLYTPVLRILDERQKKIEQGVQDADAAAEKLHAADTQKAELLTVAHGEAEEIVTRAKEFADKKGADIIAHAQEKGERALEDAHKKAGEIQKEAQKESEKEVARAAVLAAETILREKI